MHTLTEYILKELKSALKQFGEYTYFDKGAWEVMDVPEIVRMLEKITNDEIEIVFIELSKEENTEPLLSALTMDLQNWEGERGDDLFNRDIIQEYYG